MLTMRDFGDVGCWRCRMFKMWDVWNVGCSGCEMFAGMWDVDLPNAILLYHYFFFFFWMTIDVKFLLTHASNVLLYDCLYHLQGVHDLCFDESHLSDLPQQVVWSAHVKKFLNIQDNLNKIKPSPLSWWR